MTTPPTIRELVSTRRILVSCGAGGVGKTTVAAALALAAARNGRRVLALTVDPSRRLAETLGVERNLRRPTPIPADRLAEAGITDASLLETWMLDPQLVADRVIRRFARDPSQVHKMMGNRIYQQVTRMVAGMQEYTAMEALHGFVREGRYDLVILDTPPSRNALDFLEGPGRLRRFFDGRIFQLFVPGEQTSVIRRAATRLINGVLGRAFGDETFAELQEFFVHFAQLFVQLTANATDMRSILQDPEQVGFLLVTSTRPEALTEARFFRRKTEELALPFSGYLLNRSMALQDGRQFPDESLLGDDATPMMRHAYQKFLILAELERSEMLRDRALLDELRDDAGEGGLTAALPVLPGGVDTMEALLELSDLLWAR